MVKDKKCVIITGETGKLVKTKNNSDLYKLAESKNRAKFLSETIDEKFELLDQNKNNRKIAVEYIKKIVASTLGTEVAASIVCYDGLSALIPMTSILLTSGIFSTLPIKLLKKSNKNIDFLEQVIPCLQEELVKEQDKIYDLKKNIKNTTLVNSDNYELKKYSENDLEYIYSKDKKKVKVKVK